MQRHKDYYCSEHMVSSRAIIFAINGRFDQYDDMTCIYTGTFFFNYLIDRWSCSNWDFTTFCFCISN